MKRLLRLCSTRKSRRELLSTSEASWATTKSVGMWKFLGMCLHPREQIFPACMLLGKICPCGVPGLFGDGAAASFAFLDHRGDVVGGADLPGSHLDTRMCRDQLNRVVQVARFEDQKSSQQLFGFRKRPVGHGH